MYELVEARFLALGMPIFYESGARKEKTYAYDVTRDQLDAIYASQRLALPFEGVLLFGF